MDLTLSLRPDFRTYIIDKRKVVFFSENNHFLLQSEVFVEITKLLQKDPKSASEIVNLLSSSFSSDVISGALHKMMNRFVVETKPEKLSASTSAFWYQHEIDPAFLEDQQNKIKISIINPKNICLSSINKFSRLLKNLGFSLSTGHGDLFVIVLKDYLAGDLNELIEDLNKWKKPWLPLRLHGNKIWLGPIFSPSSYFCWHCVERSLKENRRVEIDLFGPSSYELKISGDVYLQVHEEIGFSITGTQLAKWLTQPNKHRLLDNIFTFDIVNLESHFHQTGLIFCELCQKSEEFCHNKIDKIKSSFKIHTDHSGPRSCKPEKTLEILEKIVSPLTGILPTYKLFEVNDTYVACATQNPPLFSERAGVYPQTLRVPDIVVGKGSSILQAKIGCFAEGVERYNSTYFSQSDLYCSFDELPSKGIHPQELLGFSEKQYTERDFINKTVGYFNHIPIRYDGSKIRWSKVFSISDNDPLYLPSAYCFMHYPFEKEISFCPGDSNGCASGNSVEEALFYSILELIERDAVALWWYNRLEHPSINIETIPDPYVRKLFDAHLKHNRDIYLIDLSSDLKIPTFAAVSTKKNGDRIYFGTSSHLDPIIAMSRAIHELNQIMTREVVDKSFSFSKFQGNERDVAKWIATENLTDHSYLSGHKKIDFSYEKYERFVSDDFREDIYFLMNLLRSHNLQTYWLNLSYVNINFHTVKVVIPGLRHFWRRLAPGRLYTVPVKMGLIPKPLSEMDMNPISYFL